MKKYHVYILSNRRRTVYYTGVTGNLQERLRRHKNGTGAKFSAKYNIDELVYFEEFKYVNDAILREKKVKRLGRAEKLRMIHSINPDNVDLSYKFGI